MVDVTHDWDDEDYVISLETAFGEYLKACYSGQSISGTQRREVRQAFLSGIHWLNSRESYCPDVLLQSLCKLLGQSGPKDTP